MPRYEEPTKEELADAIAKVRGNARFIERLRMRIHDDEKILTRLAGLDDDHLDDLVDTTMNMIQHDTEGEDG